MASVNRRGDGWWVRWREPIVLVDPATGRESKKWRDRSRTFDSKAAADEFAAERAIELKRGERFDPVSERPTVTLKMLGDAYAASTANRHTAAGRRWMMKAFTDWAGGGRPATDLSASLLEAYARTLPDDTRAQRNTLHRKVQEVQHAWKWARKRPDLYPGVPEPVEIAGRDLAIPKPPPLVRVAAPTWDDVDACIAHLRDGRKRGDRARRIALILRYTGMRSSQARRMRWSDVVFGQGEQLGYLVVRPGEEGAKGGRGRVIPLHPGLAAEMAGWGPRTGPIFDDPVDNSHQGRGMYLIDALRNAWKAAGVDVAKWGRPEGEEGSLAERGHGSPTHSFRAAVKTGLLRAGVSMDIANYYVGHATSGTAGAYVPEQHPASSPYWPFLVAAVGTIPDHRRPSGAVGAATQG